MGTKLEGGLPSRVQPGRAVKRKLTVTTTPRCKSTHQHQHIIHELIPTSTPRRADRLRKRALLNNSSQQRDEEDLDDDDDEDFVDACWTSPLAKRPRHNNHNNIIATANSPVISSSSAALKQQQQRVIPKQPHQKWICGIGSCRLSFQSQKRRLTHVDQAHRVPIACPVGDCGELLRPEAFPRHVHHSHPRAPLHACHFCRRRIRLDNILEHEKSCKRAKHRRRIDVTPPPPDSPQEEELYRLPVASSSFIRRPTTVNTEEKEDEESFCSEQQQLEESFQTAAVATTAAIAPQPLPALFRCILDECPGRFLTFEEKSAHEWEAHCIIIVPEAYGELIANYTLPNIRVVPSLVNKNAIEDNNNNTSTFWEEDSNNNSIVASSSCCYTAGTTTTTTGMMSCSFTDVEKNHFIESLLGETMTDSARTEDLFADDEAGFDATNTTRTTAGIPESGMESLQEPTETEEEISFSVNGYDIVFRNSLVENRFVHVDTVQNTSTGQEYGDAVLQEVVNEQQQHLQDPACYYVYPDDTKLYDVNGQPATTMSIFGEDADYCFTEL